MDKVIEKNSYLYLFISLMPILSLYEFFSIINLGYFILIMCIVFKLFRYRFNIKINIRLLYLFIILILLNMIVGIWKYTDITNSINNSISMMLFMMIAIFICIPGDLCKKKLYRACKFVGIICTIFLIYQVISYNLLGEVIKGQIHFLTPIEDGFVSIEYGRPTSLFYEPAHYIIYIAPIFVMSILNEEYYISILFLIGMILSTSSTGIVMVAIILSYFIIKNNDKKIIKKILVLTILIVISILLYKYLDSDFSKKVSLDSLQNNIRVFGANKYLNLFTIKEWLLGVGLNRLSEFSLKFGISALNYANSYIYGIISFGLVGGLLLLNYYLKLYINIDKKYKIMYVVMFMVMASDQILFNRNLLYLLIWNYSLSKNK